MAIPEPKTIREQIAWSYANLARAHAALNDGVNKYKIVHHVIRNRLYYGLISGKMAIRSIYDDERLKMTVPQACYYCGSTTYLSVDHLIPKIKGGPDEADNLIWACRSCNSSKQGRDMLVWARQKGFFPSVLLLRRYLKIVARYCEQNGYMDASFDEEIGKAMPFDITQLPTEFPPLSEVKLWVYPIEEIQISTNPCTWPVHCPGRRGPPSSAPSSLIHDVDQ
jgi:5-methylcytosine-specific restriction endonuclease McrA